MVLDRKICASDFSVYLLLYPLFMHLLTIDASLGGGVPDSKKTVPKTMYTMAVQRNHMGGIIMAQKHWKIESKLRESFIGFS